MKKGGGESYTANGKHYGAYPSTDTPKPTVSVTPEPERYIFTEDVPLPFEWQRDM